MEGLSKYLFSHCYLKAEQLVQAAGIGFGTPSPLQLLVGMVARGAAAGGAQQSEDVNWTAEITVLANVRCPLQGIFPLAWAFLQAKALETLMEFNYWGT